MKTLRRSRITIWYANSTGTPAKMTDAYGNYTGDVTVTYTNPVQYDRLSTPSVKGTFKAEPYGLSDEYIVSVVTDDMSCPLKVDSRIWMGRDAYDADHNLTPFTHVVEAIIPSKRFLRFVLKQVCVS